MENDSTEESPPRRGGRPPPAESRPIRERILDIASEFFLRDGYGATSIEAIAKRAGISKRTFYHRFNDKADLFLAVARRLVTSLRPLETAPLFEGRSLEEILPHLAKVILHAALMPDALALHRLIVSEGARFPEIVQMMYREGSRDEAVELFAGLLQKHAPVRHPKFAAEQFLQMVVSIPQRRAMGMGAPMTAAELDRWAEDTARLFLKGCCS